MKNKEICGYNTCEDDNYNESKTKGKNEEICDGKISDSGDYKKGKWK